VLTHWAQGLHCCSQAELQPLLLLTLQLLHLVVWLQLLQCQLTAAVVRVVPSAQTHCFQIWHLVRRRELPQQQLMLDAAAPLQLSHLLLPPLLLSGMLLSNLLLLPLLLSWLLLSRLLLPSLLLLLLLLLLVVVPAVLHQLSSCSACCACLLLLLDLDKLRPQQKPRPWILRSSGATAAA
jgi:hypothetical protein